MAGGLVEAQPLLDQVDQAHDVVELVERHGHRLGQVDARQAGLHLSVREILDQLAGIQETVLIYPSTGVAPGEIAEAVYAIWFAGAGLT